MSGAPTSPSRILSPDVVVLDVRRPGRAVPPPPRSYLPDIALSVAVDASSAVFVRGRGLDAELAGELHVAGPVAEPVVSGGFDLRNGTFNLGGAPLRFTSGRLGFNASNIRKAFDPTLDFVATTVSTGVTASVTIGGYADAPTIALTSTPELPPDEILARIVFGQSVTQLSALQIGQIGAALAAISGVGGAGLNPLATVQKTLGLDRLSISSSSNGASGAPSTAASVEAGRYLSSRVFVGARQNISSSTQRAGSDRPHEAPQAANRARRWQQYGAGSDTRE